MTISRSTSTVPEARGNDAPLRLHRGLGVSSIVFMVVAAAAPLAVVAATVPIVISVSESIAIPLFFLVAAVILLLFTVGFTRMSKYVHNAGAFSSYIQAGLGRAQGQGAATLAIFSYSGLLIATSSYIGVAAGNVINRYFGADLPWWVFTAVALLSVGLLGYRDIEFSSRVLGILLVLEVGVVVVLNIAIFVQGGADGVTANAVMPTEFFNGHAGLGIMFAFFAFFGFEATAVFRNEAKDPDRTIPRATYISVLFIGLFYAISSFAVIVGLGPSDAVSASINDPENAVIGLATKYVSPILFDTIQVLLVTSLFACILSFHNVVTRYTFTLGRRQVLPTSLGAVSPRHGAPSNASLTVSIFSAIALIAIVLTAIDPVTEAYTWLSGAATLGLIALMTLASIAVVVFFHRTAHDKRPWPTLIAPGLAIVGLAAVLVLVIANFTVLIPDPIAATIVSLLVIASYAAGITTAINLKHRRPKTYMTLADQ